MHDAEGVFYFSAHADKKAVLDFCIMHGKENRKMCFPGIAMFIDQEMKPRPRRLRGSPPLWSEDGAAGVTRETNIM